MSNASATHESYQPDGLLANGDGIRAGKITLPSGVAALAAGTVLGKQTVAETATAAAKSGGNTGNGTFTIDATTPVLAGAKIGVYTVRCIAAAANGGTFRVEDPDGNVLGDVAVGSTFSDDIKFVIADGSSDFIVGDGFDVIIAAGTGKHIVSLAAARDGSQIPDAILAEATLETSADTEAIAYFGGEFNASHLTLGAGHTAASIKEGLRLKGITIR